MSPILVRVNLLSQIHDFMMSKHKQLLLEILMFLLGILFRKLKLFLQLKVNQII